VHCTALPTRVAGEGDELLEDVSRDHAGLLAEHGEQLRLPLVVAEEVAQLLQINTLSS
jgi:hypothetical protein